MNKNTFIFSIIHHLKQCFKNHPHLSRYPNYIGLQISPIDLRKAKILSILQNPMIPMREKEGTSLEEGDAL